MTKYANTSTGRVSTSGGSIRVTLVGGVGQGNGGVSIPCRGCFVAADCCNTGTIKMNIGADAEANLGVGLARNYVYDGTNEASATSSNPLYVPIDDISKLYFYSVDDDAIVDICWIR